MVLLPTVQIIMRNFFASGIIWGDSFVRTMVLFVTMIGSMAATRDNSHIRIDIAKHFLKNAYFRPIERLVNLVVAAICLLMSWYCLQFTLAEYDLGTVVFLALPGWVVQMVLPFSFFIMATRFLLQAVFAHTKYKKL